MSNATEADPLTATLEDIPASHDGSSAFTFRITFSADVEITPEDMRDHALLVSGGTVTDAAGVDDRKDLWELTVEPAGPGPVSILVPQDRACTETGALCTADGRSLTVLLALQIPGPQAPQANSAATGAPTISGTAQVGEMLTADTSGIADTDGLTNVTYSYQWIRNDGSTDTDIQDATGFSYTLVDADEGQAIKVKISFADDAANEETLTSTATGSVAARPNGPATGAPAITGTVQVGETLTASTSGIADSDGLGNAAFSYQWIANDGSTDWYIQDATGGTYALVDADEGKAIKVKVSFTDDAGNEESLTSAATASVLARPNTPAAGRPTISGTAQVGETLRANTSGIADDDGLTNVSYSYQWIRNDGSSDTDIRNATGASYTLVDADEGQAVKVEVSFTGDAGNGETLTSGATGEVAAIPSPLTVSLENNPASHNGTDVFTFEIRFSEQVRLSDTTLRDNAFTVDGGTVKQAQRREKGSNIGWTITVEPDSNAAVEIVLPATTDCNAVGAICTKGGRALSNRLEFTINGPNG